MIDKEQRHRGMSNVKSIQRMNTEVHNTQNYTTWRKKVSDRRENSVGTAVLKYSIRQETYIFRQEARFYSEGREIIIQETGKEITKY